MARTRRSGGARDGRRYVEGRGVSNSNVRGYRRKIALRRTGDRVTRDWSDTWASRRENNRVRRAADRVVVREGLQDAGRTVGGIGGGGGGLAGGAGGVGSGG